MAKKNSAKKIQKENLVSYKNVSRAEELAIYYGFTPAELPRVTKEDLSLARDIYETGDRQKRLPEENQCYFDVCAEEKIAILRHYFEKNMQALPQPVCLFFEGRFDTHPHGKKGQNEEARYELEILGTTRSIAEATLIKATMEILKEAGFENLYIDINSIGDKDSISRYHKDLTSYYRKNINTLEAHCRQNMKRDVFELVECDNGKCQNIKEEAPKSLNFLSEISRIHFREVLEYLESMDLPYRINPHIVGNRHFTTHSIFQIKSLSDKDDEKSYPLAVGVRYNNLAKKVALRRDVPGIGVTIAYKKGEKREVRKNISFKKPKVFFIQLGFDAKLKSLKVIEILRQADIHIEQSLSRDKMTAQLSLAESEKIPYCMIMGQKEATEDTVIVRNMSSRSQETIPIRVLPEYIRKL